MIYKKIVEFNVDERIEGYYLIKEIEIKTTSNGNNYLDIKLCDSTGDINAKLWDCKEEDILSYTKDSIVKIRGDVSQWQGKKQVRVSLMRPATDADNIRLEDYVQTAPYEPEYMYKQLMYYINKIENQDISKIVIEIVEEYKEKLLFYPAAKQNHHAIRSGLLYHIMRMLMTAERLVEIYSHINKDLLYAGIILHDIAKIDEMSANELGIVSDYTVEGQLLGHIIQGIKIIDNVAVRLGVNRETSILLQHMLLSHHYEPEFGSPKRPMIPEGELLHYIDIIDARMYDMEKALSSIETNEFTDKIWILDNRRLYKSALYNSDVKVDENIADKDMKKICVLDKDEIFDPKILSKINE
ncbi:HD domain-containing protein [Proteiniborus sp. MB09-C3]|uniref:3'-5' exoribonuclease YhaM family protein n=1 Tax=Proteiniborus sp. MB09-C3 TaxID=3050072 RepID=UPI0025559B73|nr:HD domain-containing protein [Proteiniborus sp. MB09-C3]WIV11033.1 HD domain-containing protein [Proteiniborus sp. MB09-C3]